MEQAIQIQYHTTCCGEIIIGAYDEQICLCDWKERKNRDTIDRRIQKGLNATYEVKETPIIKQAIMQLEQYFNKQRTTFDLPLLTVGTDFQKKIWDLLLELPYGAIESYQGLSRRFGNPNAIRAVSSANGANAISIFIPCHRVIGSKGQLVGYAGGVEAKQMLLELESSAPKLNFN